MTVTIKKNFFGARDALVMMIVAICVITSVDVAVASCLPNTVSFPKGKCVPYDGICKSALGNTGE